MQVNNFIAYLSNPTLISNQNEIKAVVDEFPYCQTAQLMYAYQLNKNNSILFEAQLKKAAVYCTDRKRLFKQLHQEIENKTITAEKEIAQETSPSSILKEKQKDKKPLDDLEKGYLSEAISAEILLEAAKTEVTFNVLPPKPPKPSFNISATHTFADWLKHFDGKLVNDDQQTKKENIPQADLIAKFIQEDPKIQAKKTTFYSPVNMARVSVVDNDGLVSETLALIHVEQGNYQAAINTYEKLSLRNPEKKSYFATQIKILKQKIK